MRYVTSPEDFDKEIELASRGEWEALGLDSPDSKFEPVALDDFMRGA